jgi:hypothetical protein
VFLPNASGNMIRTGKKKEKEAFVCDLKYFDSQVIKGMR